MWLAMPLVYAISGGNEKDHIDTVDCGVEIVQEQGKGVVHGWRGKLV